MTKKIKYTKNNNGCWLCVSHKWKNKKGYPRIEREKETTTMVRYLYKKLIGDIPKGLCACHKCDNPMCINPHHIFLGTNMDNTIDKMNKKRQATGERTGNHKLTNEQVIYIFKSKKGTRELGRIFNVDHSQIVRIKQGKKWKRLLQEEGLIRGDE